MSFLSYPQESSYTKKALLTVQMRLKKDSKDYNSKVVLATYKKEVAKGNAEAMYILGLLYCKGIAVEVDREEGIKWLQRAGESGYAEAWYYLGFLYSTGSLVIEDDVKAYNCIEKAAKGGYDNAFHTWGAMVMKGKGTTQDYLLAISIFKLGMDKGNVDCFDGLAYLNYKGFGLPQDYAKAVQLFESASQKGNAYAMFMTGLCYRNGYGVTIDAEKAKYWLKKSAAMGFKDSEKELADPEPENNTPNQLKTISTTIPELITVRNAEVPKTFIKVKQKLLSTDITGEYNGYLVCYDWSGQNIISKTSIDVEFQQTGNELAGVWKEATGKESIFVSKIQDDVIVFHDSKIKRTDHVYKGFNSYEFKEARLQLLQKEGSTFLVGNIQLYNSLERENEKPMYLILEKKKVKTVATAESNEILSKIATYSKPFSNSFDLSFYLTETTDVTANIYNLNNNLLSTIQWNSLSAGQQIKTVVLNAPPGSYLLCLTNGKFKKSILIKRSEIFKK